MAPLAGSISRRYARALFQIGVDRGTFEALGRELEALAALYSGSPDLQQALANPVFKSAEKRAILKRVLPSVAPSQTVQSFALLLLDRNRVQILPAAARAYREMADQHLGRVRAQLVSAQPLAATEVDSIRRALEGRTGKKVIVEAAVDQKLLGGVVARVGDLVLDGSVRTQLDSLRQQLLD